MLSFPHSVLRSQRDFASTVLRFKSYKTPSFHSPNCPAPRYQMQRYLTHVPLSLALPYMPLFYFKKKINITFVLIFFFKSQVTYSKISILWYLWLSLIWGQTAGACLGRPEDQGAIALWWSVAMMSGSWWMNALCPHSQGEVIPRGDQCHLPELLGRLDPSCPQWSGACEHNCSPTTSHLASPSASFPPRRMVVVLSGWSLCIHEDGNQP